jgi:hypothetical protein
MTKREYKIEAFSLSIRDQERTLNIYGDTGWRVAGVLPDGIIFERALDPVPPNVVVNMSSGGVSQHTVDAIVERVMDALNTAHQATEPKAKGRYSSHKDSAL